MAKRCRETYREGMRSENPGNTEPSTPPERAFILQMQCPTDGRGTPFCGRVEHILSGNVKSFSTLDELGQAVIEMLRARTTNKEKK
jgi:hypothetical protein